MTGNVDRDAILKAAEDRRKTPSRVLCMPHDEKYAERQEFRRKIGHIVEANKPVDAIESLKTVLRLSHNILRKPEDPKCRKFNINNPLIKRRIMEPNGVCELVVHLGFRMKAQEYESYYVYLGNTYNSLRVGSAMIEEILEHEVKKHEAEERRKEKEKEEQEQLIEKLRNQFLDDRKSVAARVQRERESGAYEKGIPSRKGTPTKANIATIHG